MTGGDANRLRAGITGVGCAQGGKVVTTAEIAARYDLTEEWIFERTGVRERRYLADGEQLVDLVEHASRSALKMAGRDASEVDFLLVATVSPDDLLPAQSVSAARALGIPETAVVADVNAACTGFVTALGQAAAMIESGRSKLALVCGADALSRVTDYDDPKSAPLFGDGAGTVVVQASEEGFIGPITGGHDDQRKALRMTIEEKNVIKMRGREVYANAVARISEATLRILDEAGVALEELDMLIAHQANVRILDAVQEKLGLRDDQIVAAIEDVGNTSAASIPIALARATAEGRVADGASAVFSGFGGGFVWSSIYLELPPLPAPPAIAAAPATTSEASA